MPWHPKTKPFVWSGDQQPHSPSSEHSISNGRANSDSLLNLLCVFSVKTSCHTLAKEGQGRNCLDEGRRYLSGQRWERKGNHIKGKGGKIKAWTKTQSRTSPTPAGLAANLLRERAAAAGLLGELWDGQRECCSTNPQREGEASMGSMPFSFTLPSSSNNITAEYWRTAGMTAQMHEYKYRP